jgi:hypothetical protein
MANKIRTKFIFEILGRPAEHIKVTLNQFIDKLEEIKEVKVEERIVHEPKLIEKENVQDFYSTFAEVELTTETLAVVVDIVLHMLPSHVEILEPSELKFKNFDLSSLLSNLTIKIHKYDEIAKASIIDRNMLTKKLAEMEEKIKELEDGKEKKSSKKTASKKASSKKKDKKKQLRPI